MNHLTQIERDIHAERQARLIRMGMGRPPAKRRPRLARIVKSIVEVPPVKPVDTGRIYNRPHDSPVREIIAQVCDEYGYSLDILRGSARNRYLTPARQKLAYRLRVERALSYDDIGKIMGRDHSTIIFHERKYREAHGIEQDTFIQVADALPPEIAATIEAARRRG